MIRRIVCWRAPVLCCEPLFFNTTSFRWSQSFSRGCSGNVVRPHLLARATLPSCRTFTSCPQYLKKSASRAESNPASDKKATDPLDFTTLQTGIEQAHVKLRDDLSKLRGGGKLAPEAVETLRVKVDKGSATERLSDIAQVIPRGRTLQVIASDKDHVKSISSAILSSNLNLNPQPDKDDPLQLNIILPPPTTESRKESVHAAQKAADVATNAVRNARSNQNKALQAMQKSKVARPDEVKKASEKMEKVVTAGVAEVKKIADSAKRALEGG